MLAATNLKDQACVVAPPQRSLSCHRGPTAGGPRLPPARCWPGLRLCCSAAPTPRWPPLADRLGHGRDLRGDCCGDSVPTGLSSASDLTAVGDGARKPRRPPSPVDSGAISVVVPLARARQLMSHRVWAVGPRASARLEGAGPQPTAGPPSGRHRPRRVRLAFAFVAVAGPGPPVLPCLQEPR
jgi:hypothetical protein